MAGGLRAGAGQAAPAAAATRIDYAAFSGHKLYAPKGIGMLYVREGAPFTPLLAGGGQEAGLRSGTENTAGIAALGAVLEAVARGGVFRTGAERRPGATAWQRPCAPPSRRSRSTRRRNARCPPR
ncbi:MAG: aminotransferase class V-fold PLP-dependent enzyme [Pseudorhodoferax sp.]